ncbi:MAG: hypothetical protein ACI4S4_08285 [Candidatus Ornithospirochaeta sp.]
MKSTSTRLSSILIPFFRSLIDRYFTTVIPDDFWAALSVHSVHAALYSVKWVD